MFSFVGFVWFWGACCLCVFLFLVPFHVGDSTKNAQADLCTSCMNGGSTRAKKTSPMPGRPSCGNSCRICCWLAGHDLSTSIAWSGVLLGASTLHARRLWQSQNLHMPTFDCTGGLDTIVGLREVLFQASCLSSYPDSLTLLNENRCAL